MYSPQGIKTFMRQYIHEHSNWPGFAWDEGALSALLGEVRMLQGRVLGKMEALGFKARQEAGLDNLSLDVVKSSEIEGEGLNFKQVRSSIARKLGIDGPEPVRPARNVEGAVELMLDATRNFGEPLTHERLYGWHAALFPSGYSGLYQMETGKYRSGAMQIVSGPMGREEVHFVAIAPERVYAEMELFLDWVNAEQNMDPVIKAAMAHFRFIIIHPFDDGNGRIARAITDFLLARSEQSRERFYSMSSAIMARRKQYYALLKKVQHSEGDITPWLKWFLETLRQALKQTEQHTGMVLKKAEFWQHHEHTILNERQRKVLNKLLDRDDASFRSAHYARMAKCSSDSALRDIKDLLQKGILTRGSSGGRSTDYVLAEFG